eukprot:10939814-Karenia_brevis.AAC.1
MERTGWTLLKIGENGQSGRMNMPQLGCERGCRKRGLWPNRLLRCLHGCRPRFPCEAAGRRPVSPRSCPSAGTD